MARIRSLKPEFWADEDLADLPRDARLLYAGLWNLADEHARIRGRADYVKGQLFPYDDDLDAQAIDGLLKQLADIGKVIRYSIEGRQYIFLPNLGKHQRLEPERVPSKLPPPPESQPRADESASGADSSENDARSNSLSYGMGFSSLSSLGNMEHGGAARTSARADAFERFWGIYPRKADKQHARKAWDKAIKHTDPDAICAGAERYRDDPNRDPAFTAHASTWLNGARWADDPLPPRSRASPDGLVPLGANRVRPETAARMADRERLAAMDAAEQLAIGGGS